MVIAASVAAGCSCSEDPLAELESFDGDVERDHAREVGTWQAAENGAEFFLGDGLRTATGAGAILRVTGGAALTLEEDTTIRFLATAPGEETGRVSVEAGEVEVEAAADEFALTTPLGIAVVEPGSRLRIEADAESGTRIEVSVGRAELLGDDGSQTIEAGHGVQLEIGAAEIVPYDMGEPAVVPPVEPPIEEPTTPEDNAGTSVRAVVRGAAARVRREGEEDWERIAIGETEVEAGSTVEVADRGSVQLTRGEESATLGPGRYVVGNSSEGTVSRADRGRVTIHAASRDVVLEIPGGTVITHAGGSEARVDIGARETEVEARSGSVEVLAGEIEQTLEAGESVSVPRDDEAEAPAAPAPPRTYDRGPDYRDITAQAGESFTIRDPRPPTSIGMFLPAGCSSGAVEMMTGSRVSAAIHGSGSVNVLFARGRNAYQVRCDGSEEVAAQGAIRVVRDDGARSLSRIPPTTVVDANGMTYSVLYQNRLPEIRARWDDAPASSRLTIETVGGRSRTIAVSHGRATLRSGQLAEGTHRLVFEGGGRSSPPTTVRIRFDNAADVASVQAPRERGFRMGQPVEVSGTALPGWQVRVGGAELPLDAAGRFSGTVPTSAGQRAIGIRVAAPGRGENVYIRHGAGH